MSWRCNCGAQLKCLETRAKDDAIFRRYKCPKCNATKRTTELSNDAKEIVSLITTGKDFARWHENLINDLERSINIVKSLNPPATGISRNTSRDRHS